MDKRKFHITSDDNRHSFFTKKATFLLKRKGFSISKTDRGFPLPNFRLTPFKVRDGYFNGNKEWDFFAKRKRKHYLIEIGNLSLYIKNTEDYYLKDTQSILLQPIEIINFAKQTYNLTKKKTELFNFHYQSFDKTHPCGCITKNTKIKNLGYRF